MRISSQNNQFIFNFPQDIVSERLEKQFQILLDKNLVPYDNVIDYLNSTIKDIVFPSLSYNTVTQNKYHGKEIQWREAGNVLDKFQNELDITLRSVDSHSNYFMLLQILNDYYLNKKNYLNEINIKVLDKDGDLIYTIQLKDVIHKSLSELRMSYNSTSFNEQTFVLQFTYCYIDILWELDDDDSETSKAIFDIPIVEPDPRDMSEIERAYKERFE